jgi:N-acyl-D-aspartate/D-glutamate deacylase
MYDLTIRNGTIVDGTGRRRFAGDVGIAGGRIVAVGDVPGEGRREVDVTGMVVCPGFIDIHTHYDAQIVWDPRLSISPSQGVTTVIMGNCGFTIAPTRPDDREFILRTLQEVEGMDYACYSAGLGDWGFVTFPEYLDLIEGRGCLINVGALIGHTSVRSYVLGDEANKRKEATPEEIERMREIVREAMLAGAAGFSTSNSPAHWGYDGQPVVSRWTTLDELRAIVSVLKEVGTGTFEATWGPEISVEGVEALLRATGVPMCNPAIVAREDATAYDRIELMKRLHAEGLPWFPQMPALPNTFEVGLEDPFMFALDQPPVFGVRGLEDLFGPLMQLPTAADRQKAYEDPEFRARFVEQTSGSDWMEKAWPWIVINYAPSRPELEGQRMDAAARAVGEPPAALMLDLCIESQLAARFGSMTGNRSENMQWDLFHYDGIRLGLSDAGAHQGMLCDARYPAHVLGYWVREKGLALERAVRMMTSMEAECYGIKDRGVLAEGMAADIVVFDPDTVADGPLRRVTDLPAGGGRLVSEPAGIEYVLVNGVVIREQGKDVADLEALPGRLMREYEPHRDRRGPLGAPLSV